MNQRVVRLAPCRIMNHSPFISCAFDADHSDPVIYIKDHLSRREKIVSLLHEVGHAVHYKNGCECMVTPSTNESNELAEIHAHKFVIEKLHKWGWNRLFDLYVEKIITRCMGVQYEGTPHHNAAEHIFNLLGAEK